MAATGNELVTLNQLKPYGGGHLQVADESYGGLRVKKAVDMEALLIESEAGEFGSDTLVAAQSSTSTGSSITGLPMCQQQMFKIVRP